MVGRRLNLWRLREFDVDAAATLPRTCCSTTASAKDNAADQRLVALAQVRAAGRRPRRARAASSSLPHAERAIADCLEAIRRGRAARGAAGQRLDMNYVWVHIWPVIEAPVEQLTALQGKIAPLTVGAGIEEILVGGTVVFPDGSDQLLVAGFHYQPGSGVVTSLGGA